MPGDDVPARSLDPAQRTLQAGVGEGLDLPAVVTDEVVMMILRLLRLVAGGARSELDPLYEAALGEQVEDAVDAGDSNPPALRAEGVEDLLGAQAAFLSAEELDHRTPRTSAAKASFRKRGEGSVGPVAHTG